LNFEPLEGRRRAVVEPEGVEPRFDDCFILENKLIDAKFNINYYKNTLEYLSVKDDANGLVIQPVAGQRAW